MTVRQPGRLGEQVVVPARPRPPAARQQRAVGVQHGLVGLVRDRAEDLVLAVGGVGAACRSAWSECVASTTSSKRSGSPPRGVTVTPSSSRVIDVTGVLTRSRSRERLRDRVDVGARAADDGLPLRALGEPEHPVVGEELDQEARRERPHLARVGRPHGRRLRHDQPLHERPRVPAGRPASARARAPRRRSPAACARCG